MNLEFLDILKFLKFFEISLIEALETLANFGALEVSWAIEALEPLVV